MTGDLCVRGVTPIYSRKWVGDFEAVLLALTTVAIIAYVVGTYSLPSLILRTLSIVLLILVASQFVFAAIKSSEHGQHAEVRFDIWMAAICLAAAALFIWQTVITALS